MVWSMQEIGLLILFVTAYLSGVYLGFVVGWFYTPGVSVPSGMVRSFYLILNLI